MIKTEYNKLKKIIVGREFEMPEKLFDLTFKVFYQSNLNDLNYEEKFRNEYTHQIIHERNEDLNNMARVLESYGVKVYRPKPEYKVCGIKTPTFSSISRPSSSVRDLTFIYGNTIYETPPCVRGRFFENYWLYDTFKELYAEGMNWVQVPKSFLADEQVDDADWKLHRNFKNNNYDMFFDGANLIKLGNYILYNYSSYNAQRGIRWLKDNVPAEIIPVRITDNHIDGNITALNDHTLLINNKHCRVDIKKYLRKVHPMFKDFEFLELPYEVNYANDIKEEYNRKHGLPVLASYNGMAINIISLDPKTVMVNSLNEGIGEYLDKCGFNVVPVQLRYSHAFGGNIHCCTLDVEREE